jgi:hypothetical protein
MSDKRLETKAKLKGDQMQNRVREDSIWDIASSADSIDTKAPRSSVFPVTKILAIENHKLDNIFLHVAFESQSLLKPISDQTGSDTNWRTR